MASLTGKTLGKYQLTERLGHGGMADVYKAHHTKLDRDVTIKVLHSHLIEGQDFLQRFEREAKAVAGLRHAHIVQIHDFDVEGEFYYMVMEYVNGGSLQERLAELARSGGYLPIQQVVSILRQVGEALDYAHKQGIIHRDIKPSNILLDSQGNAYLTDFGIARMLSTTQFTATGALIGTPTYMSPEQGQGLELDATSDIYSLGVVLFEMLTGKAPFASDTPLAVIHKHIHDPLPRASELRPGIPAAVEKELYKAVAKDRQDRYPTAREFSLAFEKALSPEAISRLDAINLAGERPIASLPTMRIEEARIPSKGPELATRVSGEQPPAKGTDQPPLQPQPEPAAEPAVPRETPPVQEKKPGVRISTPPHAPEKKAKGKMAVPAFLGWLKSRWRLFTALGLVTAVVIAVVAWLLIGLTAGGACNSVEECLGQAESLRMQGDLEGYINAVNNALQYVPLELRPFNAGLWCDKGDAERELGRIPDAFASFNNCLQWTGSEPSLQPLRDRANGALNMLP